MSVKKTEVWMGLSMAVALSQAAVITYTFDGANSLAAQQSGMTGVTVSDITYVQGTSASGAGDSAVAYESNRSTDNLYAISSRDMDAANLTYQAADTRFVFSLTAGAGTSVSFGGASFSFDGFVMNSAELSYNLTSRIFYNLNGAGWTLVSDTSGDARQIITSGTTTPNRALDSELYNAATDAALTGSITAGAELYEDTLSWNLGAASVPSLSAGDTIQFALFTWDTKDGNVSYYAGVDDIELSGMTVVPEPATIGMFGLSAVAMLILRRHLRK